MVSVIVPAYNYGSYITATLESVAAQDFTDWECIIVDDGSTDDTGAVVESFLSDTRFRYVKQENGGLAAARNTGIRHAKGDFLQFLDADDLVEKAKLGESAAFLRDHPEVDVVYSDMRYFRDGDLTSRYFSFACVPGDKPWMKYVHGRGKDVLGVLLEGNIMVVNSPVIRKSAIGESGFFDEGLRSNEDWDFWIRLFSRGKSLHYLDKPHTMALVRVHASSMSKDKFKMFVYGLLVLRKNADVLRGYELGDALDRRIGDHVSAILNMLLRCGAGTFRRRLELLELHGLLNLVFGKGTVPGFLVGIKRRMLSW